VYRYQALNDDGEFVEGEIDLDSEDQVIAELVSRKFVPIKVIPQKKTRSLKLFKPRSPRFDRQQFFENLFDYLDSGLSIDKALELEARSQGSEGLKFVDDLVEKVRHGGTLSTAMKGYPEHFPELYTGVVHVGEETDSLGESLKLLADLARDLQEFKQKIKSALVYPAILTGVMFLSIIVLFGFVIPRFRDMFSGMGIEMSGLTRVVVALSDALTGYYQLVLAAMLGLIFLGRHIKQRLSHDKKWAIKILRWPLIGSMVQQYNLYLISMIMHILMLKKITIIQALESIRGAIENQVYRDELTSMARDISRGKTMQQSLSDELFTQHFSYLVGVGEETGRMADAFAKLSRFYYKQLDGRIKTLMVYAEPAIIMVLGLVVGLIVVSMLQAILSINELAI
jgi:general secretion pathway protein F